MDHLLITGGEDTAVIGCYVEFGRVALGTLKDNLDKAKDAAKHGGESSLTLTDRKSGQDYRLVVSSTGVKGGGPYGYMPFLATCGGFILKVSDRYKESFSEYKNPNVYFEVGSLLLMEAGSLEALWGDIEAMVRALGGRLCRSVLSRVDCAFDLPDVPVSHFVSAYREGRFVCLGRVQAEYREACYMEDLADTGFVVGKETKLRIYDKSFEVLRDPRKRSVLIANRWGGENRTNACRIEFQLRREALRKRGVDTVHDWFNGRAEVVAWLADRWFRVTVDKMRGSKHSFKAEVDPVWKRVQVAVPSIFGEASEKLPAVPHEKQDHRTVRRKAFGFLLRIIAEENPGDVINESIFSDLVHRESRAYVDDVGFEGVVAKLRKFQEEAASINKDAA